MKSRIGSIGRAAFAGGVVCVASVAIHALASNAEARPPWKVCPAVYAPVVCDNGKTYSNLCYANLAGATGCVPIWIIPPLPY